MVTRGLLFQVVPGRARILGSELAENQCGFAARAVARTAERYLAEARESFREHRSVFQGLEPALAVGIIVRDPGSGVRAGDLEHAHIAQLSPFGNLG